MTECKNYNPDIQAQGDCLNCGHSYEAHRLEKPEAVAKEGQGAR